MNLLHRSVNHRLKVLAALLLILTTLGCSATNSLFQNLETQAPVATADQATQDGNPLLQPTQSSESGAAETTAPIPQPVGVAGERSIGDPYAPELGNTGYDVQMYTLRFAIDPAEINLAAHATIEARSTLADLGQISLDFTGFDIGQLTVNGAPAQYSREGDKLIVNFAAPLDQGEAFTLDIEYSGAPTFTTSEYLPFVDHLGLFFNTDTRRVFALSEPDGAHYWFPCNDHPRDKATYRFELTVPEEMTGLANGKLIETHTEVPNALQSGKAGDQFIWEHDYPMASYLATIGIGEYVLIEGTSPQGIPLRSYAYPEQEAAYREAMPKVGEMLDWMSAQFGDYPFEAFGYYSIEGVGASLETQTMVALSDPSLYVMAHEMAHMWFGDWVSLDTWGDMWRNEGFATYVGEWAQTGQPPSTREWADSVNSDPRQIQLNQPPRGELFGMASYFKGALVVDALRDELGEEAFLAGLRQYFKDYGGGVASHAQFQAALEEASGKSLDPLFETWFSPAPVPVK